MKQLHSYETYVIEFFFGLLKKFRQQVPQFFYIG